MNPKDFSAWLAAEVRYIGSAKAAAEKWGISPQYLGDILKGKREPGEKLLSALGMVKHVSYLRKDQA